MSETSGGINIKMVHVVGDGEPPEVAEFLRRPAFDADAERAAQSVLDDVRARGDQAVSDYMEKHDGVRIPPEKWRVTKAEMKAAWDEMTHEFVVAAREVVKRVQAFARAGLRKDWSIASPRGGTLGEQFVPFERVGVYVPGGAAPLVSTVLMTVPIARVAGVQGVVVCTPPDRSGGVHPALLFALELAGASEVYRIGGVAAIGAMAFGTATVRKVQKIVGPGGPFVTAAKRQVYGHVALDMVAGPSEIAVLADETAPAKNVAADMLSQAEHGTGLEKALLVTSSAQLAAEVREELRRQAAELSRREAVMKVLEFGTLIVVVNSLDAGMDLCNRFAPEHLEIMVREPRVWVKKVRSAGAVFAGAWSPECAGDYVAGPSHVLPTGGTAAMFSGLTVDDFRRRTSVIALTRADLQDIIPLVEAFGRAEGFDAHIRSAKIRFD